MQRLGLASIGCALTLLGLGALAASAARASPPVVAPPSVLITGSNRGIGFEFVRQYAERGWTVIATTRNPAQSEELTAFAASHPRVRIQQLDVVDEASVTALARRLQGVPIDVLINNAGGTDEFKGQSFGALAHDRFVPLMELNAHGPIRVSEALIENVKAGGQRKIVAISSLAGSFGAAGGGLPGGYWYRASKSALNMLMFALGRDLAAQGISVACLSPGQVDTHGYAARGIKPPGVVDIKVSVAGLIRVIDSLTPATAARFIRFDGEALPW